MMNEEVRDVLLKMRAWIDKELEKGRRPGNEPFVLTSLNYCAIRVFHPEDDWLKKPIDIPPVGEEALALLREVRIEEWQMGKSYDVMGPLSIIFLINRALKTRS